MDIPTDLPSLSVKLRVAKLNEESAREKRIAIEEQIAALIPTKEIGSKTVTLLDGSKIIIKRDLIYKAELEGVRDVIAKCNNRGMGLSVPIKSKTTYQLDEKGYEWYKKTYPQIFSQLTKYVSTIPRKVSVTLKPAKE